MDGKVLKIFNRLYSLALIFDNLTLVGLNLFRLKTMPLLPILINFFNSISSSGIMFPYPANPETFPFSFPANPNESAINEWNAPIFFSPLLLLKILNLLFTNSPKIKFL